MIDKDALFVLSTLHKAGHRAFLVGGCVRDLLLQKPPKDFDVSTSAKPEEIRPLFHKCFLIGKRFRLAHVHIGLRIIEVATFRKGDIEDASLILRDNEWGCEEEDAIRRDFTINGLFYDPIEELIIDYVEGYKDAKNTLLRAIGNPFTRFKQDPVRMIRLIKFRARFGLDVEQGAIDALFECRKEILKSSKPRVLEEILRMLESGCSNRFFQLLREHQILPILLPQLSHFLESPEGGDIFSFLESIDEMIFQEKLPSPSRAVLLSALVYPLLKKHLFHLNENRVKPMHLGEIHNEALFIIQDLFTPFLEIPRKIVTQMISILTTQYRFTPLEKKKHHKIRIPGIPDFPLALNFLSLRARLEPGLQGIHEEWSYFFKKHERQRSVRKQRG